MAKQLAAARTCKPVENYYSRRMAKKAAAQNGRADLPVSQDAQQRVPATKKENSLAPSDASVLVFGVLPDEVKVIILRFLGLHNLQ